LGRFVDKTWGPAFNGSTATEAAMTQVTARNLLGQPTSVKDANGVSTSLGIGAFGRKFYERNDTGAWSKTTYFSCASGCPSGAAYAVQIDTGGAPTAYA